MTGRIFITGDKHGSLVPFFGLAQRNELTPADILLIAGDAGYVWREHDSSPLTTLQQLFPGTVAFVDGNHENHALLNSMEVQLWNGGRVHRVDERVSDCAAIVRDQRRRGYHRTIRRHYVRRYCHQG